VRAIVIDIDGTLTDEHRQLNCKAASAIRRLEIPVILASGNVLCFVKCAAKLIGTSDIMMAENGGVISMGYDGPIHVSGNKARCEKAFEILSRHMSLEDLDGAYRQSELAVRRNFNIEAARQILLQEGIKDIELVDTGFAVHIKNTEIHKGTGLVKIAGLMGLNPKECAAIGDSANDIEMIKASGLGIAVDNAHPTLKEAADLVTSACYGNGVIEALEYISKSSPTL
jgi:phosphoglycolate phosphatase (TIGR01487 family)